MYRRVWNVDVTNKKKPKLYDRREDFNFPFIYAATFKQHFHMEYLSLSWSDISELVIPIIISLIAGCCWQGSYQAKGSQCLSWSHHFKSFTVYTMTCLTLTEYRCHKWPRICSVCRNPQKNIWNRILRVSVSSTVYIEIIVKRKIRNISADPHLLEYLTN